MIYIGTYPYKEILEYTKYMGRKVDKQLKRDIVQLINNDLDKSRVKEISDFEELLTMDFTRLKSIYDNFKKPFGIEGIENIKNKAAEKRPWGGTRSLLRPCPFVFLRTANIQKNPLLPNKSSGFFVFSLVFSFRGS